MKGFSLIETIFYIAILGIILPSATVFSISLSDQFQLVDPRIRMEQKAGMINNWFTYEMTAADSINITASTLGETESELVFVDDESQTLTISVIETLEQFPTGEQTVHRLQLNDGSGAYFLTDADMNVTRWQIDPVRDSTYDLTGINIALQIEMLNAGLGAFRSSIFSSQATVHLQPHTTEL